MWSPRPTEATLAVRSNGPMYLGHGFRQPNFATKFGASVMGIGPYALRGDGTPGSSYPTDGCGELPQLPWAAVHSGAFAARMGGMGGSRSRDHPQSAYQRRTIPQSRPLAVTAPFTQGSLALRSRGMGGNRSRDHPQMGHQRRTIPQSPSGRQLPLHKGALGTGVRAAEVVDPYGRSTEVPATGRCRHRPLRVVAESCRDLPGSALSAERVAGQIRFLPDDLRVQHGVQRSEVSAKPRPCSRRGCGN